MTVATGAASSRPYIRVVEAARGAAAAYVVLAHVFQILGFKQSLASYPLIVHFAAGYAHQAVLFFFLLSGFSIHYSSSDRPLGSWSGIRHYYYLRVRRVVPIFLVAVSLTLLLLWIGLQLGLPSFSDRWRQVDLRSLLFTLGFLADREGMCGRWATVLPANPPIWSLAYEMFYYSIYPIFWRVLRQFGLPNTIVASLILSVAAAAIGMLHCDHLLNVLALYGVWCIGAATADLKLRRQRIGVPRYFAYVLIPSALYAIWITAESAWNRFDTPLWMAVFVPLLVYPVSEAAYQSLTLKQRAGLVVLAGMVISVVMYLAARYPLARDMASLNIRFALLGVVWLLLIVTDNAPWRRQLHSWLINRLEPLGRISYALYLLHYPILVFAFALTVHWAISAVWALLCLPVVIVAAWALERKFQPAVVRAWNARIAAPVFRIAVRS